MASVDPYLTARSNIRDNVKMLSSVFAGVAGVLLAGTPFLGFGQLEISSPRFLAGGVCLLGAGWCLLDAVRVMLEVLRPDIIYSKYLKKEFNASTVGAQEKPEIELLRKEFEKRKESLLPNKLSEQTYDAYDEYVETLWKKYMELSKAQPRESKFVEHNVVSVDIATSLKLYESHKEAFNNISYWAAFWLIQHRYRAGMIGLMMRGAGALLSILLFAWAANPPRAQSEIGHLVYGGVNYSGSSQVEAIEPGYSSVLFELGQAAISAEGYQTIERARDILRLRPKTIMLVSAHTDTTGNSAINKALAMKRANAVIDTLVNAGGIAADRIFVAELPKHALPKVTGQDAFESANRVVKMAILDFASRR